MSVAWVAVGASLVGSVMSSNASSNAADSASASAQSSTDAQERTAGRQLDFAKEQDADNKIRYAKADALTERVTDKQLESMDQNMELAADYDNYNKTVFRPLETEIVGNANAYDTPQRQEEEAGKASASVKQNIAQATEANQRSLARMGVNPSSGRSLVTKNETAITGALGESAAENSARKAVETMGAAKQMDAASLGRNLPRAQATSAGLGLQAGNNAVSNNNSTNAGALSGSALVGNLNSSAGGLYGSAASNYSNVANAANSAAAASSNAWGQVGGMALNYGLKNYQPAPAAMPTVAPPAGGYGEAGF